MISIESIMTLFGLMLTCFSLGYVLGINEKSKK